jgi:hypothetical protein
MRPVKCAAAPINSSGKKYKAECANSAPANEMAMSAEIGHETAEETLLADFY